WRMMRRGCAVDFVHFHSAPFHDRTSQEKARQIAAELVRWELDAALHLVAFGEVQRQIVAAVGRPLRVVLYRRMMLRIAEAIGRPAGAEALVTGESLGQVASQTLPNLAVIEAAVPLPVLRPLIGMDKGEISAEAARLGTFETSIIPDQDCCQLFMPPHPATRAHPEDVAAAEARLDVPALVALGVAGTERVRLCYPAEPAEPPALPESVNESPPVARRPVHPASRRCSSSPSRPGAGGRAPCAARRRGARERPPAGVGSRRRSLAKNGLTTQHVVVYGRLHTIPGRGLMAKEPAGEVLDRGSSGAEAGQAPGCHGL